MKFSLAFTEAKAVEGEPSHRWRHSPCYVTPPPHSIRARRAAASLIAALALLAAPATAQVDWDTVFDGEAGQVHCPPGKTHHTGTSFVTVRGIVKADRADVRLNTSLDIDTIRRSVSALITQTSIPISFRVYQGNDSHTNFQVGTVTTTAPLAPVTRTVTGLQSNTRHAADLVAGNNVNNVILTTCFRTGETPADMSRPLGHHDDINHGDWASGCFAFADRKGPNHRKKVIACFCGARNSSGDWARTDSADGFTYMLPDARRTELGCTTN